MQQREGLLVGMLKADLRYRLIKEFARFNGPQVIAPAVTNTWNDFMQLNYIGQQPATEFPGWLSISQLGQAMSLLDETREVSGLGNDRHLQCLRCVSKQKREER